MKGSDIMKNITTALAALAFTILSNLAFATDIGTAQEFVNAISDNPSGSYTLTANIDLTGSGFATVAEFLGTIDGAGHTLSGIGAKPLFTAFCGSMLRLTVDGTVSAANTVITVDGTSAIAVKAYGARFEDVIVKGYTLRHAAPSKNSANGLFVGTAYDGCRFVRCATGAGSIVTLNGKANNHNGGFIGAVSKSLAGQIVVSFVDCTNNAEIVQSSSYNNGYGGGGFIGYAGIADASVPKIIFNRCVNNGTVSMTSNAQIGGFVGYATAGSVKDTSNRIMFFDCINNGTISATGGTDAGGFIGQAIGSSSVLMDRCVNRGTIDAAGADFAGGLVGYCGNYMADVAGARDCTLLNCANYGAVSGKSAAGLISKLDTNTGWGTGVYHIYNCVNIGTVTGTTRTKQLAGYYSCAKSGNGSDNCFGLTEVSGPDAAGSYVFSNENYVYATQDGYSAADAVAALNAVAADNDDYDSWVVGSTGYPELAFCSSAPAASYIVHFRDWNGTILKKETVAAGGAATAPANPSRNHYTFSGWDKTFSSVNSDLVVNAVYSSSITVTFDTCGGTACAPITQEAGTFINLPSSELADHTLEAWANDDGVSVKDYSMRVMADNSVSFKALWKKNEEPYVSKLVFLQWDMKSMDATSRAARQSALSAIFAEKDVDVAAISGLPNNKPLLDLLIEGCPGYSYACTASNGSGDANGRVFFWKTSRFEQWSPAVRVMPNSNATIGWCPIKEIGTQNAYVLVSPYYGPTKTIKNFVDNSAATIKDLVKKHPTATILIGQDLYKSTESSAKFGDSGYGDYAGLGEAISTAWQVDEISATDDWQYTELYRPWADYADNMVKTTVQISDVDNQVNPGYVTTFKFGVAPAPAANRGLMILYR